MNYAMTHSASMTRTGMCDHCGRTFSYVLLHNGFNDSAFAYCDKCGRTAVMAAWSKKPTEVIFQQGTLPAHLEGLLAPCECGGKFRVDASPRCPHCHEPLSATLATEYIERNAPGTVKGWRWHRSWKGLYAMIVEGQMIKDPSNRAKL